MFSGENEYVEFADDCMCDGPVEHWLQVRGGGRHGPVEHWLQERGGGSMGLRQDSTLM